MIRYWRDAVVAVLAGYAAMLLVASAGLAFAGAGGLPDGAFPRVVAAVVVLAAGGVVEVSGGALFLTGDDAPLTVMPLSVSLAGALAVAWCFLRPLRGRAVTGPGELLRRAGPLVVSWLAVLTGLGAVARHTFGVSTEDSPLGRLAEVVDAAPTVGFRADLAAGLLFGLLWILGLLLVVLLVSRRAPLPAALVRFQEAVRPAAYAVVVLLLGYVALGAVVGLVVAVTRGQTAQTLGVLLLCLPNLVWPAFTVGLGGAWHGAVERPFGLPVPTALDGVLRAPGPGAVDVGTLAARDPRAWWLVVVAALAVFAAGCLTAVRSPARVGPWRHALHLGVALALGVLAVCLLAPVQARFGLALFGIGEAVGLGGRLELLPELPRTVGLALVWGAVGGFTGALAARPVHRRGEVGPSP
ncbi:streptophobe family protein [Streptomyces sp. NPDC012888]|uniref:streptophobe family protein n=1 Tax=Streptomyces sp. NPDC012888 TaxID=3364855 RepID=UPI00369BF332